MSSRYPRIQSPMPVRVASYASIALAAAALVLLALLHAVSPEFDPSWRMVSEYAEGSYGWVLALMFAAWGVSDWALIVALWGQESKAAFRIGLACLFLAGAGTAMASLFDVNQPLHNVAQSLGVPGLPIGAMLVSSVLGRNSRWEYAKRLLCLSANLTWIVVVLFALNFAITILSFHLSGIAIDPQAGPTAHAPSGVIGFIGWTDRLIVVVDCAWVIIVATDLINLTRGRSRLGAAQ